MITLSSSKASIIVSSLTLTLLLCTYLCNLKYLPSSNRQHYSQDEHIYAEISSLTSMIDTLFPLDYYDLPFCKPSRGVQTIAENISQLLMRRNIQNSPYQLRINMNESLYLCTKSKLTKQSVELLRKRTDKLYHVNRILDDLPLLRSPGQEWIQIQQTGFPIAYHGFPFYVYYIMNHLKFTISLHETKIGDKSNYEIVGFEVSPCSIKRDVDAISELNMYDGIISPTDCVLPRDERQEIEVDEIITFTYEVEYRLSNITWLSRSEAYSAKVKQENFKYMTVNSMFNLLMAFGFTIFAIFRIEPKGVRNKPLINDGISKSDIAFRDSRCSMFLCIMVGNGIQIVGMAIVSILFAVLGLFNSPILFISVIILYLIFGIVSGYVSVLMWTSTEGNSDGWKSVSCATSCVFSSIIFILFSVTNIILYTNGSTAAFSISIHFTLLALWFCVLVPFTHLGGFIASRCKCDLPQECPSIVTNNINERGLPHGLLIWINLAIASSAYIVINNIELSHIFSSIWRGKFIIDLQCILTDFIMLVVACAFGSGWQGYMSFAAKDWNWGWIAFFASGSSGFCVFIYSVKYLIFDLRGVSDMASSVIYICYSMILALAITLSTGAVGFFSAFGFLHFLAFMEKL